MTNPAFKKHARRGEQTTAVQQRRQRFYSQENQWFFRVRGEQDRGPFASYAKARNELAIYLRRSGIVRFTI